MIVAAYGNQDIHARVRSGTAMLELYLPKGGDLPVVLKGLFTNVPQARKAVQAFQGKNRANQEANAKRSTKKRASTS